MAYDKRTPRTRGRALQRLRAELFQREPLCRPCHAKGRVTLATQRDHIIPLGKPFNGQDVDSNVQPICDACHEDKTHREFEHTIKPTIGADGWPIETPCNTSNRSSHGQGRQHDHAEHPGSDTQRNTEPATATANATAAAHYAAACATAAARTATSQALSGGAEQGGAVGQRSGASPETACVGQNYPERIDRP